MEIKRIIDGKEVTIKLTAWEEWKAYSKLDEQNCRDDIQQWAANNEKTISQTLEDSMVRYLAEKEDSNISRWDNIASAYYACKE